MKTYHYILTALFFVYVTPMWVNAQKHVWQPDVGNGTYKNPILYADYSDPDVIRVGDDYYMTASSFNCVPGLPILHSKDLVNWQLINYALKKLQPEDVYDIPQHGKGVWAPSFTYHNGELYIYYPDPDYGIYMIKAKDPAGQWSKPQLVMKGKGIIDPSVLWDTDGQAYLAVAWAASRAGVNSLLTVFKLNKTGTQVVDDGHHVYDGHGIDPTIEGPKLYKRHGYYYILCPAGGVTTGYQLALRSKNIYGPYERKIVMAQGNTDINGPHQGALVHTQTGEDWFLHFQDRGTYGRVTLLEPVKWANDWPVIGMDENSDGCGEPVHTYKKPSVGKKYPVQMPEVSDEFNDGTFGLQWQWQANPKIQWFAALKNTGYLRLFAYPSDSGSNLYNVPNLLLQKFPAPDFTVTTKVKWNVEWDIWQGKKVGLIVMGNDYACLSITKNEQGFFINQVICKDAVNGSKEQLMEQLPLKDSVVYMRVSVRAPDATCAFSYSEDGIHYHDIGKPFKAQQDKWIGAKVGLFCTSTPNVRTGGYADFDWFRVRK